MLSVIWTLIHIYIYTCIMYEISNEHYIVGQSGTYTNRFMYDRSAHHLFWLMEPTTAMQGWVPQALLWSLTQKVLGGWLDVTWITLVYNGVYMTPSTKQENCCRLDFLFLFEYGCIFTNFSIYRLPIFFSYQSQPAVLIARVLSKCPEDSGTVPWCIASCTIISFALRQCIVHDLIRRKSNILQYPCSVSPLSL